MKKHPQTNKRKQKTSEDPSHQLFTVISLINSPEEAKNFLEDLCTPAELQAMADRWRVVFPLQQEEPYRQIYEKTGVSVTTITRVARVLRYGAGGYNTLYQRIKKRLKC